LIIDDDPELSDQIENALIKAGGFRVLGKCGDGENGLKAILKSDPDIVVLDVILPVRDGLSVLEEALKSPRAAKAIFIVITAIGSDSITKKILDRGADYIILKPFSMELLVKRILENYNSRSINAEYEIDYISRARKTRDEYVSDLLKRIGVPVNLKGYAYLKTALNLCLDDARKLEGITKVLYPTIARAYGATPARVERDIRHSLEVAWASGADGFYYDYVGYRRPEKILKPTNGEFISSVVERARGYLDEK
jgi:two-component system response regulator (stage 0 sporulation protein A)